MDIYDKRKVNDLALEQFRRARNLLDAEYGAGFSKKNPEAVTQFMIALSNNYLALNLEFELKKIEAILEKLDGTGE